MLVVRKLGMSGKVAQLSQALTTKDKTFVAELKAGFVHSTNCVSTHCQDQNVLPSVKHQGKKKQLNSF